jgi:hypothetical protein
MIPINELLDKIAESPYSHKRRLIESLKHSPDYSIQEKAMLYDRLSKDTCFFAKVCFRHIVRDVPKFHEDIYTILDSPKKYKALVVFRGAAKSTLKVIFACQRICNQIDPFVVFMSESEDQAIDDLRTLSDELCSNDIIQYLYFNDKSPKGEIWATTKIELTNGTFVIAKGMNSRIRGTKHKAQRPTLVILDDFESKKNADTAEKRKDLVDTILSIILPMGDVGCEYIFLGTLPNNECFLATETRNENGIFRGSMGEFYKKELTYINEDGEEVPTWEARYNWEWINSKKAVFLSRGEIAKWNQEYYNIPESETDPILQMDMIKEIDASFHIEYGIKYILYQGKKILVNTFSGVDPACVTHAKSDRTCVFSVAILPNKQIVIIDIMADRIKISDQVLSVVKCLRNIQPIHCTVETIGYQLSLKENLDKYSQDTREWYYYLEYKGNASKSKKFLEGLAVPINQGMVSYIAGCRGIEIFLNEGNCFYGGFREHDDTLDGFYLALNKHYAPADRDVDSLIDVERKKVMGKSTKKYNLNWETA